MAFALALICLPNAGCRTLNTGQSAALVPVTDRDQMQIYDTVLGSFLEGEQVRQLVSTELSAAPTASDPDIRDCTKNLRLRADNQQHDAMKSLAGVDFRTKGVELIDGSKWSPVDPAQLIAQGKSVESSVKAGFSHSLISFSQVAFSHDGKDALVNFSMTCGALCGAGATLHLRQAGGHWSIVNDCAEWIS
jgi:hypothetical protein